MTWRDHALCLDEDPELFFPNGVAGPAAEQAQEAKAVCGRCPVQNTCLQWAVDTRQEYGVWGGLTEGELRSLRRRSRRAVARAG